MHSRGRTLLPNFDDARIRSKLLTGFAAVVLPLVALGVATLTGSGIVRIQFDAFVSRDLPQDKAIDAVEAGTTRLLAAFNHLVSVTLASRYAGNASIHAGTIGEVRAEVVQAAEGLRRAVDQLGALPTDGETEEASLRSHVQYVALGVATQVETAVSAFAIASPDQIVERARAVGQKAANLKGWVDELHAGGDAQMTQAEADLTATINTLQAVALGGMALAVLIAIVTGALVAGRIARPIQSLRQAAIKLGNGDFAALDGERRTADEIGDLVDAFQETARKLRESQEKLGRTERLSALGQIAGSVGHELRNPLGTIRNSMSIVRQLTADKGLGVERALDRIERGVQRCDAIVADILEFSRPPELQREPTAVDAWLDDVLDEHEVPAAVEIRRELAANATVLMDRTRFRQVLVNLIDNAVQAMLDPQWAAPANRTAVLTVRSEAAGPHVRISVTDNGPGIAEDQRSRIFEPLFTTKVKGIGLGLPTVRKLVEQHGGAIDVESRPGEETTFTVWLPRQPGRTHTEPAAQLAANA